MTMGFIIPADPLGDIALTTFSELEDYQSAVAGYIEMIDLEDPSMTMIVNEEGKVQKLPVNRRATLLLWSCSPKFAMVDIVCGDALIVGPMDNEGDLTDVPVMIREVIHNVA